VSERFHVFAAARPFFRNGHTPTVMLVPFRMQFVTYFRDSRFSQDNDQAA
jgi:hypothetical protein